MSLATLRKAGLAGLAAALLAAGIAAAALVEVNNLVLRADGGFHPQSLPRHRYAPIDFQGHFDISARSGGQPVALRQALVDFDRDGRLSVAGLPTCPPERVAELGTSAARAACKGAIVGTGNIGADVTVGAATVPTSAPLTIFNGPRLEGNPTVVLHARTTVPATQTYAIVVPIVKRAGQFRYRAIFDVPPIAGGYGAITHVEVRIGRRYRADGQPRSYVAARCADGILRTHGRFTFADGTIIDGSVEKFCHAK
jgi:hypothetical protein